MKSDWQETTAERFKNLVLEWMEETSQFLKNFYTAKDINKIREMKQEDNFND